MRIRTVKPEWLDDETMALAPLESRVLSIALILLADDHGNGRANPTVLAARVFPGEENPRETLAKAIDGLGNFLVTYENAGQMYFHVRNWAKHQKVDKPGKNIVPPPPDNIRECPENIRETLAPRAGPGPGPGPFQVPIHALSPMMLERTIESVFSSQRQAAWKSEHGKPGGAYRRGPRDFDSMAHAVVFFSDQPAHEPAIVDSVLGFMADSWAKEARWPFAAWAKDPGKYMGMSGVKAPSTLDALRAEEKAAAKAFREAEDEVDRTRHDRREEVEKVAEARRVALMSVRDRLRTAEARQ